MDILKDFLKSKKGIITVSLMLFLGFILIFSQNVGVSKNQNSHKLENDTDYLYDYLEKTEEKLSKLVSNIDGAGKTEVMITLQSSFESVFASNAVVDETSGEDIKRNSQKELVLRNSKIDGDTPIVIKQLTPKIEGVVIVCEGGNNIKIKNKIIEAVSVAFNISANRVCVVGKEIN